ncbi:MAG: fumarylacetoacetate hydrolase family protein [Anaerolinea sp.]|nr:fumarylacetoacetate hydrolase family protein [Anaerolinea sp.]
MRLITFSYNDRTRIGELVGDTIYALAWVDSNVRQMIRRGVTPSRSYERFALKDVKIEAPINPGKIVAIGKNYAEHAAETGSKPPESPAIFAKFPSTVIATNEPITWRTSITNEVDYEGELAVVIGKTARDVKEEDALNYVYGYTIANDVSARDLQLKIDIQWTRGKSLDTFCPIGPVIVTADEVPDPQNLMLTTTVNGEVRQHASTADMVFGVRHLIAYCSRSFTLEPGDVIITGTPSGVALGMKPQVYLKDGDVVSITIDGIGELTNPCKVLPE